MGRFTRVKVRISEVPTRLWRQKPPQRSRAPETWHHSCKHGFCILPLDGMGLMTALKPGVVTAAPAQEALGLNPQDNLTPHTPCLAA